MISRKLGLLIALTGAFAFCAAAHAQEPQGQAATPPAAAQTRPRGGRERGPRPTFGKITAIKDGTIELSEPNGGTITVKISDKTEFHKDRQPSQLSEFKVGDMVAVRGEQNSDQTITAQMIASRTGGPGGGFARAGSPGEMGKDFVVGEVTSIDPPKLTILRSDNVTQTLELNEDTTLRRGRDSITMADIQVGDHVFARGAVQNDVFVPKGLIVMSPEQWQRMQEMGAMRRSQGQTNQGQSQSPAPAPQTPPQPEGQPH